MTERVEHPNAQKTCWNCPAVEFKGHVDFRACGQAAFRQAAAGQLVVECKRQEEIGYFDPMSITYDVCPEYGSPLPGRPLFEGLFPGDAVLQYGEEEWSLGGELVPRDPVSFYHVSKVQGTFTVYEACKYWWLRSVDVMQGVVYGLHTPELVADARLHTRFDIDEWWGTVVNRFVAQSAVGMPMTIFGSGNQMRGYIAIGDAMQCMVRLISNPPEPGQYDVVNQVTDVFSVRQIAETVGRIGREEFGLNPVMERIENPRVEAEEHPYHVMHGKLEEAYGFRSEAKFEAEVRCMFQRLLEPENQTRIERLREVLFLRTLWSGAQKKLEVLETIEF